MKSFLGSLFVLALSAGAALAQNDGNARVRVVHASPDAPNVDVYVDGAKVLADIPFREYSEYLSLPPKTYDLRVNVAGTGNTVLQAGATVAGDKDYTVIAKGLAGGGPNALSLLVLEDNNTEPGEDKVKLRVVHAAPGAPAVDVYVTSPFEALDNKMPVLSNVPFGAASDYLEVPAATYQARVTPAGTKTAAIDSGRLITEAGQIRTVVAVDAKGGGAPFDFIVLRDRR